MTTERLITNLCADDLAATRDFYVEHLGFAVGYDSDWYVQLRHPDRDGLELGIIRRDHDLVPDAWRASPTGMYLTFVVADADEAFERLKARGVPVVQPPRNEFYGQRRFLVRDPAGCLVDICSPWSEDEK